MLRKCTLPHSAFTGPTINSVHSNNEHDTMCLGEYFLMFQKITVLLSVAYGSPSVFWIVPET
jgi:hypothetical protein